jgi:hypothetical protein
MVVLLFLRLGDVNSSFLTGKPWMVNRTSKTWTSTGTWIKRNKHKDQLLSEMEAKTSKQKPNTLKQLD